MKASLASTIDYKVIRSARRKTLSLQVKEGVVIARAPTLLPNLLIEQFVHQKQPWLISKVNEQVAILATKRSSFEQGEKLPFLGEHYTLNINYSDKETIYLDKPKEVIEVFINKRKANTLASTTSLNDYVQSVYYRWLKHKAETYLPHVVNELNVYTQLQHQGLVIKRYKARWGSCNNKGEISLNYLLMTCPDWVIRYVIIHELCHLKYLNHSSSFWKLVSDFYPLFRKAKLWLKTQSFDLRS